MRFVVAFARLLLGGMFVFGGLTKVLGMFGVELMKPPADMPAANLAWMSAMAETHYFMPLLGISELVGGLMVLTGFMLPLGLIVLAPIVLNILLFHHFVDRVPANLPLPYALLVAGIFLAYAYGSAFRGVLERRVKSRFAP